jgi:diguanylate cyclase (GGDEF)-like protein/PAS domain S-box-containing protein
MPEACDPVELVAALPDVVFVLDTSARLGFVSPSAREVLGWEPEQFVGRSVLDIVHEDDIALVGSSIGAVVGKRVGTPIEVRVRNAAGAWQWLEVIGADHTATRGVHGVVCVARDLTQRRMWEVAAGDVARFQQVVQHARSITLLLDADGVVTSTNGAFTRLLGHDPSLVVGQRLAVFAEPPHDVILQSTLDSCRRTGDSATVEIPMCRAEPRAAPVPLRFEIVDLVDDPIVAGIIVTGHDISELDDARRSLEHLVRHDVLTGLANRALLRDRLDDLVAVGRTCTVVFVDLDRFKPVNDLLGHETGDDVLRVVAERLVSTTRPGDLVARVGGDEFVMVALDVGEPDDAAALARRIEQRLAEPYLLPLGPVRLGASAGFAIARPGATVDGLLAEADAAMYAVKDGRRRGGTGPQSHHRRAMDRGRRLAEDLAVGIARGEVSAHLQPIVDIASGRTLMLEALARWQHPDLGLLSPRAFIDLAEYTGLDMALGDAVLRSACETLRRAGQMCDVADDVAIAVNLSGGELAEVGLRDRIARTLREHDVSPQRLVVEITEDMIGPKRGAATDLAPDVNLLALDAMGVRLALDDFGTGDSSLTAARRLPLSMLKVDGSFVRGMTHRSQDRAVVAAVIGIGKALGVRVVAEAVESADQLTALAALGCDAVQGHHVARPLPPDDAVAWLRGAAALAETASVQATGETTVETTGEATAAARRQPV